MPDVGATPRDRILRAASDLLASGGRGTVTTRAVSAAADVQPQTIYRHFGDMSGLLAEAAHEGFRAYVASKSSRTKRLDPVDDLRDAWDWHIEFGIENPAVYLLMYGEPDSQRNPAAASEAVAILRDLVEAVARAGRLRVDVDSAAAMIYSTGVGVVITLIGSQTDVGASSLSRRVREAVLSAIITEDAAAPSTATPGQASVSHAAALRALIDRTAVQFTPGEALLFDELLARVSSVGSL